MSVYWNTVPRVVGKTLTAQPAKVLPLLLEIDVLRHPQSQLGIDPPLIQVLLQQDLQVLIQVRERGAPIQPAALPLRLRARGLRDLDVLEEVHIVDRHRAVLRCRLNLQRAAAFLLDRDVHPGGEAGLVAAGGGVLVGWLGIFGGWQGGCEVSLGGGGSQAVGKIQVMEAYLLCLRPLTARSSRRPLPPRRRGRSRRHRRGRFLDPCC